MTRESDDRDPTGWSRRGLLALTGVGIAGSLAGCSGGESTDGVTATEERTTAETDAETATETETATDTGTATETEATETEATETAVEDPGFDAATLAASPSSHVAPTDGFADATWLSRTVPEVLRVTTLDGSGEGSLRWALERYGPRIVVFEVGGVVDLAGDSITVTGSKVFVAGQTAPSPGITLVRGGIEIEADDVLIQHLRVRPGDEVPGPVDGIGNGGGSNVVVDHCSVTWSSDESVSTNSGPGNPDVTFTNNLIAECLHDSVHHKGPHSYGTLVMDRSRRVTIAGNLFAHNTGRHPRLKGGSTAVVANNVVYNFARAVRLGGGVADETRAAVVGNYYRAGELTDTDDPIVGATFTDEDGPVTAYVAHNATDPGSMPITRQGTGIDLSRTRPLWPDALEAVRGEAALDAVLASAGARPADRTHHDRRIVEGVREGTGARIDSQTEVGGYPNLEATARELDVPGETHELAAWLHDHTVTVETGG